RNNHGTALGGGLDNNFGIMKVDGVTFEGNSAGLGGGAVSEGAEDPQVSFTNCTFVNNTAPQGGGGLCLAANFGVNQAQPASAPFVGNSAATGGGVGVLPLVGASCTLTFQDPLFASSQNGHVAVLPFGGMASLLSDGHNLADASTAGFDPAKSDQVVADLLL